MGLCIEKLPHLCGTKQGLQVFQDDEGNFNGYCFSCSTSVPNPYGDVDEKELEHRRRNARANKPEWEGIKQEVETFPYPKLEYRKLKPSSLSHYNVKASVSEQDGETPVCFYYPITRNNETVGFQVRFLPEKKFWFLGRARDTDLFGWREAVQTGAKTLFITEGPNDCIALYQALKDKQRGTQWEHLEPAVVSLTKGVTSAAKELASKSAILRAGFQDFVFVPDTDEAGKKFTEAAMKIFPTARVVQLPLKDPHECVENGRSRALADACLFRAQAPKNTRLVWARDLIEAAAEPPQWGLAWPWEGITDKTRGMRFGETIYIGAGVKMGKSEIVNALISHLICTHNLKVFAAKPEEANRKTIKLVAGKIAGKRFHDPKVPFDLEAYYQAAKRIGDSLCLLNLYQHIKWPILRQDILAAVGEGCKAVFIDPITNLTNGVPAGEANTVLQDIAQDLSAMALDNQFLAFIFCHLKAPESGLPHEEGGKVYSTQFAGSRAMMRSCNYMLALEGNKSDDLPREQRNIRRLRLLEDREFGEGGGVTLYWDEETTLFNEVKEI